MTPQEESAWEDHVRTTLNGDSVEDMRQALVHTLGRLRKANAENRVMFDAIGLPSKAALVEMVMDKEQAYREVCRANSDLSTRLFESQGQTQDALQRHADTLKRQQQERHEYLAWLAGIAEKVARITGIPMTAEERAAMAGATTLLGHSMSDVSERPR
jgi:FtsZ-binding cell division protein ZapB